ncbi:ZAN-like protein, partial [Mya arenaria]
MIPTHPPTTAKPTTTTHKPTTTTHKPTTTTHKPTTTTHKPVTHHHTHTPKPTHAPTTQTHTPKPTHAPTTTTHKPRTTIHKPTTTTHKPRTTTHKPTTTTHKPTTTTHKPTTTTHKPTSTTHKPTTTTHKPTTTTHKPTTTTHKPTTTTHKPTTTTHKPTTTTHKPTPTTTTQKPTTTDPNYECESDDYVYDAQLNLCLRFYDHINTNWTEAKKVCQSINGTLVVKGHGDQKMQDVLAFYDKGHHTKPMWVGATTVGSSTIFIWDDGTKETVDSTDGKYLSNVECLYVTHGSYKNWSPCSDAHGFICERVASGRASRRGFLCFWK